MQKNCSRKLSSCILCMVLIVAAALFTAGCNGSTGGGNSSAAGGEAGARTDGGAQTELQQLGEGSTKFNFTVVDREGNETFFEIHTDCEMVGEALVDLGLIAGEESGYGLYVTTVNGIIADYDRDGAYWAFYINGEYAFTGVDVTPVTEGESYSFKVEKA